mmetsp:Transcript_50671/g.142399  ORF Transcript_50671/g.142399 Transcript_50671/m.142399 type:complete len:314 (-) Transcript_50671:514-1455(-)
MVPPETSGGTQLGPGHLAFRGARVHRAGDRSIGKLQGAAPGHLGLVGYGRQRPQDWRAALRLAVHGEGAEPRGPLRAVGQQLMVQPHVSYDDRPQRRLLGVRHQHERADTLRPQHRGGRLLGPHLLGLVRLRARLQVGGAPLLVLHQRRLPLEHPRLRASFLRRARDVACRRIDGRRDLHAVLAPAADHEGAAVVSGRALSHRAAAGASLRPRFHHFIGLGVAVARPRPHDVRPCLCTGRRGAHHRRCERVFRGGGAGHAQGLRLGAELHARLVPEHHGRCRLVRAVRAGREERVDVRPGFFVLHRFLHLLRV